MKDQLKALLEVQAKDLEIDHLKAEIAAVPGNVSALKAEIQVLKAALEAAKKDLNQFQLAKKQKELDLDTRETSIRKHSGDLNAVKTNDAYRALLGEIEKAKGDKSKLEDEILQLMEQIDGANKLWKEKEATFKGDESSRLKQISDLEAQAKTLDATLVTVSAAREQALAALPRNFAEPYERLRKNRKGAVLVPILKEQCSGCHMKVSQNLINEIRRGLSLMTCESCSRIVYLEEAPAPAAAAAVKTPGA